MGGDFAYPYKSEEYHIRVHWVKVRGHSNQHGNDKADESATWGQNGGRKNVENMTECMAWLKASTQVKEEDDKENDDTDQTRHNDDNETMNTEQQNTEQNTH